MTSGLAYRVIVHGRVQGVYFRACTVEKGKALSLAGWVRNRSDGTVESFFQGNADDTAAMLAWLRIGSPGASVTRLDVRAAEPVAGLRDFVVA
ncbi:MAG: acylphosphatase [Thermodesulfobacteriota bacterium]